MSENYYTPQRVDPDACIYPMRFSPVTYWVVIEGEEYKICNEYSHKRASNAKVGNYGRGHMNTDKDPRRVERTGLKGEMAYAKLFGGSVDLTYRSNGDQLDFTLRNRETVDVKLSCNVPSYEAGLIQVVTEKGTPKPLLCDWYVVGCNLWDEFNLDPSKHRDYSEVCLIGAARRADIESLPISPARAEGLTQLNQEIHYNWDKLVRIDAFRALTY